MTKELEDLCEIEGTVTISLSDLVRMRAKLSAYKAGYAELRERINNTADSLRMAVLKDYETFGIYKSKDTGETFPDNLARIRITDVLEMLGKELNIPQESIDEAVKNHEEWEKRVKGVLGND